MSETTKRQPAQMKLAGFSDEQAEEIEGVLEHYKAVETAAKEAIQEVRERQQNKVNEAAEEVVELMEKYGRKAIALRGWTATLTEKQKLVVKGSPRKERGA